MTAQILRRFLIVGLAFMLAAPILAACADPWPDAPATLEDQVNGNDVASVAMFIVDPERAAEVNQARLDALLAVQDKALSHEQQMAAAQAAFDAEQAQRNRDLAYAIIVVVVAAAGSVFVVRWLLAAAVAMMRAWAGRKPAPIYQFLPDEHTALPGPAQATTALARRVTPGMDEFSYALSLHGGWLGADGRYYMRRGNEVVAVEYFTEE